MIKNNILLLWEKISNIASAVIHYIKVARLYSRVRFIMKNHTQAFLIYINKLRSLPVDFCVAIVTEKQQTHDYVVKYCQICQVWQLNSSANARIAATQLVYKFSQKVSAYLPNIPSLELIKKAEQKMSPFIEYHFHPRATVIDGVAGLYSLLDIFVLWLDTAIKNNTLGVNSGAKGSEEEKERSGCGEESGKNIGG